MKNLAATIIISSILIQNTLQSIYIQQPDSLKSKFLDSSGRQGYLDYSVSTFGYLDYQQSVRTILLPVGGNQEGCDEGDYFKLGNKTNLI